MAKTRDKRRIILLECTSCGLRTHATEKNTDNTPDKLEIKKYCPKERKHTVHKEITKLD